MSKVDLLKAEIKKLDDGEPMEAMFEDGCRLMNEEERQNMRNGLVEILAKYVDKENNDATKRIN